MVPYADFNLLKFPDKAQAMEKIRDPTCLSDTLPTGFHGAITAKVGVGSTVYVADAGPVGPCGPQRPRILGAAAVLIGDMNQERLAGSNRTHSAGVLAALLGSADAPSWASRARPQGA
jgi:glutathione-independent formaldehyde dehydrogenase